jgi:MFS family permease
VRGLIRLRVFFMPRLQTMKSPGALSELRSGWRVIVAALIGIAFGVTGLFFYSVGIFLKPVASEFGWSRTALSGVTVVAALTLAATAPFVGWIVDRIGARTVAVASSIGLSLGFLLLSIAPGNFLSYVSLIALTVLLGAGAAPILFTRIINTTFDSARGTALGLAQMATGLAAALMPPLLIPYINTHGWRAGYVALAIGALVSMPVVVFLIGGAGSTATSHSLPGTARTPTGLTFSRALRTGTFFKLAVVFGFAAIGLGGMIVHLVPMLTDSGLTPARAGTIAALLGVAIILGRALTGVLVDRAFAPRVAFVVFGAAACGCWLLAFGGVRWAGEGAVLVGLAMGAEIDLISYLVARYFGLAAYGKIYGWLYAVFMIGTSIGPLTAGAAFDRFGNYQAGVAVLGAALGLAAVATWLLEPFPARFGSST